MTEVAAANGSLGKFQSTSLMRGMTLLDVRPDAHGQISIHIPHARDDSNACVACIVAPFISIHIPHARDDSACFDSPQD